LKLRPVNYNRKNDKTKVKEYGLIAEEVEKLCPQMVTYDKKGKPETVEYYRLIPVLVKVIQDQEKRIKLLESRTRR